MSGTRLLLNGVWSFAEGPDGSPPAAGWRRLRVPHRSREFEAEPPDSGWYRTTVRVPAAWNDADGARLWLDLGRVRHYGRAYLDGERLDEHWSLRRPWRIDVTERIAAGGSAELTVYTHSCRGAYAHPCGRQLSAAAEGALDTRFWYTSAATIGMEGDVWLARAPRVRVDDASVVTSVRQRRVGVEVTVRNDGQRRSQGRLRLRVRRGGHAVLDLPEREVRVDPGQSARSLTEAPWPDPVLWGHPPYGEPVLYFLHSELWLDGEAAPVDTRVTRFGFREVWAEGDRLLLNGRQLVLWGDHSVPYVHERQWLTRKLPDLAASGVSIVEHHRHDAPPVLYDVADELGAFVVSSNFCAGTGQVPRGPLGAEEDALVRAEHLAVLETWIRRDRNHPSILFWDVTDAREPAFCVPLLRRARQLDSSRIVEVTFDPEVADDELVSLVDAYRLFSSLEKIEATLARVRSDPALPAKPVRVGEAGIFARGVWGVDEEPPLLDGWWEFLRSIPERNLHGLQTFYLTDMDYRGFALPVPGMLAAPLDVRVSWPSQSGADARIDPFGEGTQAARGKAALYLNWCDPSQPVSRPTRTRAWSRALWARLSGEGELRLAGQRVPEVIATVVDASGRPVAGAQVFAAPVDGQGLVPYGVQADEAGTSWFALPEPGRYRFSCGGSAVEVATRMQPIDAPPGYDHVERVALVLGRRP